MAGNREPGDEGSLLAGTRDGVYRLRGRGLTDSAQVLAAAGSIFRVRRFAATDGVFAAGDDGLFRSRDGGERWERLSVPGRQVWSVAASPDGRRLYAGTHPARLAVSSDDGASFRELEGLSFRPRWGTPRHRGGAQVRSLAVSAQAPELLVAGIEVGGVHASHDGGETWSERSTGLDDDVHHVLLPDAETWIASCGGGLYRSLDAGRSWRRLAAHLDRGYFRESHLADGVLLAAAAHSAPPAWDGPRGADGALYESLDLGTTFQEVDHPGRPRDLVLAWTRQEGRVVAGTQEGRILRRRPDGCWWIAAHVPAPVLSLAAG